MRIDIINRLKEELSCLVLNTYYKVYFGKIFPSKECLSKQKQEVKKWHFKPLISIITPIYKPNLSFLNKLKRSIVNQSYTNWQWILVVDGMASKELIKTIKKYSMNSKKITFFYPKKRMGISAATNYGTNKSHGGYVSFVDQDDVLWPNALYEVAKIIKERNPDLIYTDEDKILSNSEKHYQPFFKPEWSPELLLRTNYIVHLVTIKRSLFDEVGQLRAEFDGAQDWDLLLRLSLRPNLKVAHINKILYSWRSHSLSTADKKGVKEKNYAYKIQFKMLNQFLETNNYDVLVKNTKIIGLYSVDYSIKNNNLMRVNVAQSQNLELIKLNLMSNLKINRLMEKISFELV